MNGKTVVLTGATQGIGRDTARGLARKGARLILVNRDANRAKAVADEILAENSGAKVELITADLSVQSEVRRAAAEILAAAPKIDVLLNNAGGIFMKKVLTTDGLELTFALNHLAYFLLTNLLLERLKASAPARIVSVSSAAHYSGKIDFDNLQQEKGFKGMRQYPNSKLMNVLFTMELSRRLEGTRVTANCLHPGLVRTGFGRNGEATWLKPFIRLMQLLPKVMITAQEGAETSIFVASDPSVEGVTGKYFDAKKIVEPLAIANDRDVARRLWEISEERTGLAPRVAKSA